GREILVHPRYQVHVVLGEQRPGALQGLVEAAQRRPGIAADQRGDAEVAAAVGPDLVEDHADERLDPGDQHTAVGHAVLRVEAEVLDAGGGERHDDSLLVARLRHDARVDRSQVALYQVPALVAMPVITG